MASDARFVHAPRPAGVCGSCRNSGKLQISGNNLLVFCCVYKLRANTGDQPPQGGQLVRCHRGSRL